MSIHAFCHFLIMLFFSFFQCWAIRVLWMRWGKVVRFDFSVFLTFLLKRLSSSQCISLPPLPNVYWLYKSGFTSGLFILFHSSMCLFCVSTIMHWTAESLYYSLKSRNMKHLAFFLFFKIVLLIRVFTVFKQVFEYICEKMLLVFW